MVLFLFCFLQSIFLQSSSAFLPGLCVFKIILITCCSFYIPTVSSSDSLRNRSFNGKIFRKFLRGNVTEALQDINIIEHVDVQIVKSCNN